MKFFATLWALLTSPARALGAGSHAFSSVKAIEEGMALVASGDAFSGTHNVAGLRSMAFAIKVDTLAGGNVTAVVVQESWDGGATWTDHTTWTAVPITADGFFRKDAATEVGPKVRLKVTSAVGVSGNFDFYVGYIDPSMDHPRSP
jgi:hypothetical protein